MTDGVALFVDAIWGHGPHSICGHLPGRGFEVLGFATSSANVVDRLDEMQDTDIWIGAHPLRGAPQSGRGGRDDVAEVVALPTDLDWAHETRRTETPLPTEAEVRAGLKRLGPDLQPSIVVNSGHGLQAWWLLDGPVAPDRAERLIAQLDAALATVGLENGRPDLASIMRLPGTRNHKGGGQPVPVVIEKTDLGRRFLPEWLRKHLPAAVTAPASGGGTRHCRGAVTDGQQKLLDYVVAHHGAHSVDIWRDGSIHVVRPGKPARDGTSASIITGEEGDALLTVFSDKWPAIGRKPGDKQPRSYVLGVDGKLHHPGDPLAGFTINAGQQTENGSDPGRGLLVPLSAVRSRRMKWLWPGHVPLGEFSLVAGLEKIGKSVTLVGVAAYLTRGHLPGEYFGEPVTVVYISSEDHAETVLKARAKLAGADLDRFYVLDPRSYGFSVERTLALRPAWVILDPVSAFMEMRAGANEHGEVATRQALLPFNDLAHLHGVATTGVRHLGKGSGDKSPYDAVLGSKAWTATPRSVVFFVPDPRLTDTEERHGLIYPRGNFVGGGGGSRYHLEFEPVGLDDGTTDPKVPRAVLTGEPAGMSLEEALGATTGRRIREREAAKGFLEAFLADGPKAAKEVYDAAAEEGITERTLQRAAADLGVRKSRLGGGQDSFWTWRLPGPADTGKAP